MKRKVTVWIGIILLGFSFWMYKAVMVKPEKKNDSIRKRNQKVEAGVLKKEALKIDFQSQGVIKAYKRMDIYSEYSGIMKSTGKDYKKGQIYLTGEPILRLDEGELKANLMSLKSEFKKNVTLALSDIRYDFPTLVEKWSAYQQNLNLEKTFPPLPKFETNVEENYMHSKGIISQYYNVLNLEKKLEKYTIRAPFNGVLTDANLSPGTLIRPGQLLGEFINTESYELEAGVTEKESSRIEIGNKVSWVSRNQSIKGVGTVVRMNGKLDAKTQRVNVYIQIDDNRLREGQFIEVSIHTGFEKDLYPINRNAIVDKEYVYQIKGGALHKIKVDVAWIQQVKVYLRGLKNGDTIVTQSLLNFNEGQKVSPIIKTTEETIIYKKRLSP